MMKFIKHNIDIQFSIFNQITMSNYQITKEDGLLFTPANNKSILRDRWNKQIVHTMKHGKVYRTGEEVLFDLL